MYECLAFTCHLHFGHSDWGLLCAAAVSQGWNPCQNKSKHRKLSGRDHFPTTPTKTETASYRSWVWHSTTELSLAQCYHGISVKLKLHVPVCLHSAARPIQQPAWCLSALLLRPYLCHPLTGVDWLCRWSLQISCSSHESRPEKCAHKLTLKKKKN